MATVSLPSGNTAEVTEPDALTAGSKLAVQRSVQVDVKNGHMVMSLALTEEMKVAALIHLIKSWSFQEPVSLKAIEALSIKDYNALTDSIKEHMKLLRATPDKSDSAED